METGNGCKILITSLQSLIVFVRYIIDWGSLDSSGEGTFRNSLDYSPTGDGKGMIRLVRRIV